MKISQQIKIIAGLLMAIEVVTVGVSEAAVLSCVVQEARGQAPYKIGGKVQFDTSNLSNGHSWQTSDTQYIFDETIDHHEGGGSWTVSGITAIDRSTGVGTYRFTHLDHLSSHPNTEELGYNEFLCNAVKVTPKM